MDGKYRWLAFACTLCTSCSTTTQSVDPVGRLYHYVRTNQDESSPEHVWVYRKSKSEVEVVKEVEPCTRAAYVTAILDNDGNFPKKLVGGQLNREGTQDPFAFLEYDPASRKLSVRVPPIKLDTSIIVQHVPWRIYDFDLADLTTLSAGRAPSQADFSFGVALIWPSHEQNPLEYKGLARAKFAASEDHLAQKTLRFLVTGSLNGDIWLDARDGHVVEARFAEPNHAEYKDFRLVLRGVESNAAKRWEDVRLAHWQRCRVEEAGADVGK